MEIGAGAPSVDELFGLLYAGGGVPALHGEGFGIDRSGDGDADGAFVFAHQPPDRWLLERPAGRLRAVGDSRGEVAQGRDEIVRRVGVGVGWAGEPAAWLLRLPVTGTPLEELRSMAVIEPVTADEVAGRRCWRFVFAGPVHVWADAALPILLRVAAGGSERATARWCVEITNLSVGSTGHREPIGHPFLEETREPIAPASPAVEVLRHSLRGVIPEARDIEVFEWTPEGVFQVRFRLITPRGVATVLLDRRGTGAEPYERMCAGLVRAGDDRWCLSLDHDPELDHGYARELAGRLSRTPIAAPLPPD